MKRLLLATAALLATLAFAGPAAAAVCQSPKTLSTFSVLRRAATPSDSWPRTDLLPPNVSFDQPLFRRTGSLGGYKFFLLPAGTCGSPQTLYIGALGSISTVQGGATLSQVKRFGEWIAQGKGGGSLVAGLLPDGVAKVTVTYPKGRGHPGGVAYPHAVRKTVRVRNNMALFRLGRTPDDASSPSRQIWLSKSGRVIRRAPGNP
jgi:hypothetical protein